MPGAGAKAALARSPVERRLQPVVTPEQFAVRRDEARRAENTERLRFFRLRAQRRLDLVVLSLGEHARTVLTEALENGRERSCLADVPALAELGAINGAAIVLA